MKGMAWIIVGFLVIGLWISWLAGVATVNAKNAATSQKSTARAMERWADSMESQVASQWADSIAISIESPRWTETLTSKQKPNQTIDQLIDDARSKAEALTR